MFDPFLLQQEEQLLLSGPFSKLLKLWPELQQLVEHGYLHRDRVSVQSKQHKEEAHTQPHNLRLSEDVWTQLAPFLQNLLRLFRRDVYLQGGGHGGADEAADDGGNLLLDGGLIAVGMTEVLQRGQTGNDMR